MIHILIHSLQYWLSWVQLNVWLELQNTFWQPLLPCNEINVFFPLPSSPSNSHYLNIVWNSALELREKRKMPLCLPRYQSSKEQTSCIWYLVSLTLNEWKNKCNAISAKSSRRSKGMPLTSPNEWGQMGHKWQIVLYVQSGKQIVFYKKLVFS